MTIAMNAAAKGQDLRLRLEANTIRTSLLRSTATKTSQAEQFQCVEEILTDPTLSDTLKQTGLLEELMSNSKRTDATGVKGARRKEPSLLDQVERWRVKEQNKLKREAAAERRAAVANATERALAKGVDQGAAQTARQTLNMLLAAAAAHLPPETIQSIRLKRDPAAILAEIAELAGERRRSGKPKQKSLFDPKRHDPKVYAEVSLEVSTFMERFYRYRSEMEEFKEEAALERRVAVAVATERAFAQGVAQGAALIAKQTLDTLLAAAAAHLPPETIEALRKQGDPVAIALAPVGVRKKPRDDRAALDGC